MRPSRNAFVVHLLYEIARNKTDWQERDGRKPIWVIELKGVVDIIEKDVDFSVKEICTHRAIRNNACGFYDEGM